MPQTRRQFLAATPLGLSSVPFLAFQPASAQDKPLVTAPPRPPSGINVADDLYPSQDPSLVREMVGAAHSKLDRVRELLDQHSALAKCAWDWGFGDWETALGAASHTGQREIAALLIEHGARPDLFTFAMLGRLEVVKAYIEAHPGLQRIHGPHGITLLKHAQAGGDKSAAVVEYLSQLGDADVGQPSRPLPAESAERYLGEYSSKEQTGDRFAIIKSRSGEISIRRGEAGSPRILVHQGDHAFQPKGAPRVNIRFELRDNKVEGLTIEDGPTRRHLVRR